ncbi:MAG: hypothetical protein RLZZ417_1125 [Bacteroidota bacterium]
MNRLIRGNIQLVGAGPGDPELITLKGIKAIKQATYILYDALIHKDLLKYNRSAIKTFVGKRAGLHSISQREISLKMVELAGRGERVVRLKGGDVFVFGRASEELTMARLAGIETGVIPGISSFSGISSRHKIPLTQRGISESFWVVTGTTADGQVSGDIVHAAKSTATVIVFMGLGKINEICTIFKQYKPLDYPVAVISNGTLPEEKTLLSTIENIAFQVKENDIEAPALFIFGPVLQSDFVALKNQVNLDYVYA